MQSKIRTVLMSLAGLGILFVLTVLKIYQCPLRFLIGIPCPFCGMSRAFLSLLKGDVPGAFFYHPLWPLIIIILILYILYEIQLLPISKKQIQLLLYIMSIVVMVCFVYRHMTHSPIVEVHFEKSIVGGLLCQIPFF